MRRGAFSFRFLSRFAPHPILPSASGGRIGWGRTPHPFRAATPATPQRNNPFPNELPRKAPFPSRLPGKIRCSNGLRQDAAWLNPCQSSTFTTMENRKPRSIQAHSRKEESLVTKRDEGISSGRGEMPRLEWRDPCMIRFPLISPAVSFANERGRGEKYGRRRDRREETTAAYDERRG
ncbi:hypothetical protein [Azospirillum doebereinerae]